MTRTHACLYPELATTLATAQRTAESIAAGRRAVLEPFARYLQETISAASTARAIFICTHNSRRSQLAEVWAQTLAHVFAIAPFESYSGGTEVTACNPRTVAAMERAGFRIQATSQGDNPVYTVRYGKGAPPIECFSKLYHQPPNPTSNYCAVMTCSHADASCPVVLDASLRLPIYYDDPGVFDGTNHESATYDALCHQIAGEMMYVFSRLR